MTELRASPPAFIFRFKYACTSSIPPTDENVKGWPRNIFGHPMAYCPCRMEAFPDLQEFLDARYEELPPETSEAMQIYKRRK